MQKMIGSPLGSFCSKMIGSSLGRKEPVQAQEGLVDKETRGMGQGVKRGVRGVKRGKRGG